MNGPHDLGGAHGFGPVCPEPGEPVFHERWERDAFALTIAMGVTGAWPIDRSRHARESLPPPLYLGSSYYRIWFEALERLLAERGDTPPPRVLTAGLVRPTIGRGGPTDRPGPLPAFAVGARVRVKPMRPATHTRAPAYVRGRVGTVTAVHGPHVFPDTNAHGRGENPRPLYTVAFAASDLWGEDTTADEVSCDLFEPYLTAAP